MSASSDKYVDYGGFSLIETLVALVITGLALTAIAGVFAGGLTGHRTSENLTTALSLAEARLAEAGAANVLQPGHSDGVFANRFHWRLTVSRFDDRSDDSATMDQSAASPPLFRVAVRVTWRDGLRQREFSLTTLRFGTAPP